MYVSAGRTRRSRSAISSSETRFKSIAPAPFPRRAQPARAWSSPRARACSACSSPTPAGERTSPTTRWRSCNRRPASLGEAVQRARTEEALRKSETRLKQLIASTLDAVISIDSAATVIEWNPQAEATFGIARARRRRPAAAARAHRAASSTAVSEQRERRASRRRRAARNGEEFPVEVTVDPVGRGAEQTFTAFIRDISERKRAQLELEQREQRFRALVEKSWSGVVLLDGDLALLLRRRVDAAPDRLHRGRADRDQLPRLRPSARARGGAQDLLGHRWPAREQRGAGRAALPPQERHVGLAGRRSRQNLLHEPSVGAIVLNYRDITQRKATEKQLEYQAYYDALTGLPNRLLFRDRLVQRHRAGAAQPPRHGGDVSRPRSLQARQRRPRPLHRRRAARRRSPRGCRAACARPTRSPASAATSSRILLTDIVEQRRRSPAWRARSSSRSRIRSASTATSCSSPPASASASSPTTARTWRRCSRARTARCIAPRSWAAIRRSSSRASMNERYVRRLALEQGLHHALERDELEVYYQPIFDRVAAAHRRRSKRCCAGTIPTRGLVAAGRLHPAGRGHRTDRPDRRVGAAHACRAAQARGTTRGSTCCAWR